MNPLWFWTHLLSLDLNTYLYYVCSISFTFPWFSICNFENAFNISSLGSIQSLQNTGVSFLKFGYSENHTKLGKNLLHFLCFSESPDFKTFQSFSWKFKNVFNSIVCFSWKEYFPNLLETALLCQFFVYWVSDFKYWQLAYFLIFFNRAKFQQD